MDPSEEDIALGAKPKELFNPFDGSNILLKIKKASGFFNYDADASFGNLTIIHYGSSSTTKAKTKSYINLYKSKIQFIRLNYGIRKANIYKHFLKVNFLIRTILWRLLIIVPIKNIQEYAYNKYINDKLLLQNINND